MSVGWIFSDLGCRRTVSEISRACLESLHSGISQKLSREKPSLSRHSAVWTCESDRSVRRLMGTVDQARPLPVPASVHQRASFCCVRLSAPRMPRSRLVRSPPPPPPPLSGSAAGLGERVEPGRNHPVCECVCLCACVRVVSCGRWEESATSRR